MAKDIHGDDDGQENDEDVTIMLASRKMWRPFRPSPDDFEWTDLGFPLGRIPRFNGQLQADGAAGILDTYSDAQHLCLCSDLAALLEPELHVDIRLAIHLHDGEEALGGLGDPVGPVKHAKRFRHVFRPYFMAIQGAIALKAQIDPELLWHSPIVKTYDRMAYAIENYYLRGIEKPGAVLMPVPRNHRDVAGDFRCWSVSSAGGIWMAKLQDLLREKGIPHG
jgi:hypothetical protein